MARNGSGTYSLPSGNPVVTGATIRSTDFNNTMSDIAAALTASLAKDGQTSPTADLPMATYKHTGVGAGTALTHYARYDQLQNSAPQYLTSVSGYDTITAAAPVAPAAYASGQKFHFIAASANTGAVTLNISSLGAKAVKKNGTTALVAGDIPAGAAVEAVYDGTNFQLVSGLKAGDIGVTVQAYNANLQPIMSGTATASTSGTYIDFTSIPSWVKRITVNFVGVSTSGASSWIIQLGDSGGIETSGYLGASSLIAGSVTTTGFTNGFGMAHNDAASVAHGSIVISLVDASTYTWSAAGTVAKSDAAQVMVTAGSKSLSAALDQVRITTSGGSDTFDAGKINILYE